MSQTALADRPAPEPLPSARQHAPAALKILVIEDCVDMAESLCMVLELLGYQARATYTGPDGVHEAAAWRPDVVLSDIGLPGLDGFEVARRLRKLPGLSDVLLVAVTAYGSEEDRRRGREAGFDHYLVKPVEVRDLRRVLPT
jgi:CheY-like chemotaxis protein